MILQDLIFMIFFFLFLFLFLLPQKSDQTNGLPDKLVSKRAASPAVELELNPGALRLDGLPPGAGAAGPGLRVAQVRLLDRRSSSRPSSRPGTPTSNSSSTPTPSEDQNDGEEEAEAEEEALGSELEGSSNLAPAPRLLKRPFQLLIAAAMERNPTQFQLPNELTCTTALPGTLANTAVFTDLEYFVESIYGVRIMPKPRTHAKRVLLTHNDSHTHKTCFTHAQ